MHQVMGKDSVVIHLSTVEGGTTSCQIIVDDVDQLYQFALKLKLKILYDGLGDRPWGCRDFTIQDADGNSVTFSQQL